MSTRRSSARLAGKPSSSPPSASKSADSAGRKRKEAPSEQSPASKRGKNKEQKTLEETFQDDDKEELGDDEMKDAVDAVEDEEGEKKVNGHTNGDVKGNEDVKDEEKADANGEQPVDGEKEKDSKDTANTTTDNSATKDDQPATEEKEAKEAKGEEAKESDETSTANPEPSKTVSEDALPSEPKVDPNSTSGGIETSTERAASEPSQILEKGIIYIFVRARVNVENPQSVKDIARTYMVLRPLPTGGKLGDGPIEDLGNNRLLALPKKVFPKSHSDTFMTFVEKAGTPIADLKETLSGSSYSTKTTGVSHSPHATPVGEGIYALTTTGSASRTTTHLAYILTIPNSSRGGEPDAVQESLGLGTRGSFILSVKNPAQPSPAGTSLPDPPNFDEETQNEFGALRWMPARPKHLDTPNAQMLMIGEGVGELRKAVEQDEQAAERAQDEKVGQVEAGEEGEDNVADELEKLSDEELARLQRLNGDESVFEDLGISAKDWPGVLTTW